MAAARGLHIAHQRDQRRWLAACLAAKRLDVHAWKVDRCVAGIVTHFGLRMHVRTCIKAPAASLNPPTFMIWASFIWQTID